VLLNWQPPNVGAAVRYSVYRIEGAMITLQNATAKVLVNRTTVSGSTLSVIDGDALSGGKVYTYYVIAEFANGVLSSPSNFVQVTGK
jgi:hypothetical protein